MTVGPRFRFHLGVEILIPLLAKNANNARVEKNRGDDPPDRLGGHILIHVVINEDKNGVGAEHGEDYTSSAAVQKKRAGGGAAKMGIVYCR